MSVSLASYAGHRQVRLLAAQPTFRIILLLACSIVWNDQFWLPPEFAPNGWKGMRQEIQISTCAEAPTSWNPIKECRVFVSSRLIDADDKPMGVFTQDGNWQVIKSAPCQEAPQAELGPPAMLDLAPCANESCGGT